MTNALVKYFLRFFLVCISLLIVSCASYKQNIMFKPGENFKSDPIQKEALGVERNYIIQRNDYLQLDVYSNQGERIIDPNSEIITNPNGQQPGTTKKEVTYLVDPLGIVKLPMIGDLKLEGLTLHEAEEILQGQYAKFYKEPFVRLSYANKRVIVLGALGGQVIPLVNQNVHLVEIIALAKGLTSDSKAHNLRVLRGEQVYLVDLSTLEGFQAGNMLIEPNDIIYIEPIRRPLSEGLRDYSMLFSIIVSISSLVVILTSFNR